MCIYVAPRVIKHSWLHVQLGTFFRTLCRSSSYRYERSFFFLMSSILLSHSLTYTCHTCARALSPFLSFSLSLAWSSCLRVNYFTKTTIIIYKETSGEPAHKLQGTTVHRERFNLNLETEVIQKNKGTTGISYIFF